MSAYSDFTDSELLYRLKDGDGAAYTAIFYRYNSILYIHAFRKLNDSEEAKDIVQEVFTMLWSKRSDISDTSNLAGFLYTCVHHKILDKFVHEKSVLKYVNHLQAFSETEFSNADELVRQNQLTALIEKEINALPPKMRRVFELSRKQHLSHKEIAEQLDLSQETVKSQIKNALKILRVKLGTMLLAIFF